MHKLERERRAAEDAGEMVESSAVDQRLFVNAVARAVQLLEAFSREARPLSLGEIAAATGMGKSAAQRLAYTLLALGYLDRGPNGRGLVPGLKLLDRSFDALRLNPLVERATPVLIELRKTARERIDLSLFDDLSIVYAVRLQSKRETFFATLIGRRMPTYCSSGGRAALAALSDAEVDNILKRSHLRPLTPKTITDPARIREKVQQARREGFALTLEESLVGEVVIAAAVGGQDGRPKAAVHIAGSLSEWSVEDFRTRFGPLAMEAARAIGA